MVHHAHYQLILLDAWPRRDRLGWVAAQSMREVLLAHILVYLLARRPFAGFGLRLEDNAKSFLSFLQGSGAR